MEGETAAKWGTLGGWGGCSGSPMTGRCVCASGEPPWTFGSGAFVVAGTGRGEGGARALRGGLDTRGHLRRARARTLCAQGPLAPILLSLVLLEPPGDIAEPKQKGWAAGTPASHVPIHTPLNRTLSTFSRPQNPFAHRTLQRATRQRLPKGLPNPLQLLGNSLRRIQSWSVCED